VGAGLILTFTAMAVGVTSTLVGDAGSEALERMALALVYPFGFVVCLMSGTELFTEHTATAVYPVLDRRSHLLRLLRLWFLVGFGNLLGAFAGAWLLIAAEEVIGAREGYIRIARHLVEPALLPLLASAVLAGFLMALGAWLILATPPTVSQLASIYIVTFLIGLGGLHHAIAGAAELFTASLISNEFPVGIVARSIGLALMGNLIGGSLFVAGLNYAHIRKSREGE
jgi:formate/nitrite transporter FocA (FNT family)